MQRALVFAVVVSGFIALACKSASSDTETNGSTRPRTRPRRRSPPRRPARLRLSLPSRRRRARPPGTRARPHHHHCRYHHRPASGLRPSLHLHEDPAANLVLITDDNSTPAERYQYDAFGHPTILADDGEAELPASAVGHGPRFGGMPYLEGAGLFAASARHYDPVTGVFLGFGAGFVGAATFGRAAAGITRGLLSVASRAPIALARRPRSPSASAAAPVRASSAAA